MSSHPTAPATSRPRDRWLVASSFVLIVLIGYVDGISSAYIAFSIFYVVPIVLAAWFGSRLTGIAVAVGAALCGLAADLISIEARPIFAFVNLGSRLLLFVVLAIAFHRLRDVVEMQRRVAEQEREIRDLQRQLTLSVVERTRQPLGEMYAKVVDIGFAGDRLTRDEARELVADLARATAKVSRLIESLGDAPITRTSDPPGTSSRSA